MGKSPACRPSNRLLIQEEPVEVGRRHHPIDILEHVQGGHDVEYCQRDDPVAVVQGQPVRHPPAAIVPDHAEPVVPELGHEGSLVGGHGALGVRDAGRVRWRGAGASVTAKIGQYHLVGGGQGRSDPVPHPQRLRIAVQQQERRP
jgi:hypothetical protein